MEYDPEHERARRNMPCPATNRNGEACGSTTVSVSGYCFAHDPESAAWRAKGGRESSNKRRVEKRLREGGLGYIFDLLEGALNRLDAGDGDASDARAMAKVADTMLKVIDKAETGEESDSQRSWPTKWEPY